MVIILYFIFSWFLVSCCDKDDSFMIIIVKLYMLIILD